MVTGTTFIVAKEAEDRYHVIKVVGDSIHGTVLATCWAEGAAIGIVRALENVDTDRVFEAAAIDAGSPF